jgi:hypothetical protein
MQLLMRQRRPYRLSGNVSLETSRMATPSALRSTGRLHAGAGFALVESVIGMALISLLLGSIFALDSQILLLLKQGKESSHATQMIQERVEQIRTSLWDEVTDLAKIRNVMAFETATSVNLPGVTETVKIEPLVSSTVRSFTCVRSASGNVSGAITGSDLTFTAERSVKMTVTAQWTSYRRVRTREVVTILTNGGI